MEAFSYFIISFFLLAAVVVGIKKLSEKVKNVYSKKESYELGFTLKMIKQTGTFWGFKLGDSKAFVLSRIKHLGFEIQEKSELEKMLDLYTVIGKSRVNCTHKMLSDIKELTFAFSRNAQLESISIKTIYTLQDCITLLIQIFGRPCSFNDNPIIWLVDNNNIYVGREAGNEIVYHLRFMEL